jgi:hypothetical protein
MTILKELNKIQKKALVRKIPLHHPFMLLQKKIDETTIDLPYGDKIHSKLYVIDKPYGFDSLAIIKKTIHYLDDYDIVDVHKVENIVFFRVVTQDVTPNDLLTIAKTQIGLSEWIHQPLYITIADFLSEKTNELELLYTPNLIFFKIAGFNEAYNPYGGEPITTPGYFALSPSDE